MLNGFFGHAATGGVFRRCRCHNLTGHFRTQRTNAIAQRNLCAHLAYQRQKLQARGSRVCPGVTKARTAVFIFGKELLSHRSLTGIAHLVNLIFRQIVQCLTGVAQGFAAGNLVCGFSQAPGRLRRTHLNGINSIAKESLIIFRCRHWLGAHCWRRPHFAVSRCL
ncbi:hypothetical protein GJQ54_05400 [Oceanospirillaceae bacterium ASx5O]|nr:hypothetical protein GJQ54_05400 [Oceanospirillaceae bacterium ASx5O]